MLLGVILFFDGALLALGNVCEPHFVEYLHFLFTNPDSLCVRTDIDHWAPKDILFLRTEAKVTRHDMFPGRHHSGVYEMAIYWSHYRDIWFLESLRVCYFSPTICTCSLMSFDAQRFLPCGNRLLATATIHRNSAIASLCSRCRCLSPAYLGELTALLCRS